MESLNDGRKMSRTAVRLLLFMWILARVLTLLNMASFLPATRRYLSYSEADFEVFRPAGATRCTDRLKFGTEEGPLLRANFHPIGATVRV